LSPLCRTLASKGFQKLPGKKINVNSKVTRQAKMLTNMQEFLSKSLIFERLDIHGRRPIPHGSPAVLNTTQKY